MTWILFAALTAFFESGKDLFGKKALQHSRESVVAFSWRFFSLPFLLPLLFLIEIPSLDRTFFWSLLTGGSLNVLAALCYMKALREGELSLTVPMIAFTPVFLLLTSPVLLGEVPSSKGTVGILIIVAGAYLLHLEHWRQGWFAPIRALVAQRGPRLMLLVAFIWSLSANIDKIGLKHSSPVFWAVAINAVIGIGLFPFAVRQLPLARGDMKLLLATGFCGGVTTLCQMAAISLTLVPYVIAVKRTSTVLAVVWGAVFFNEGGLRRRLTAVLIMLAGAVLIALN